MYSEFTVEGSPAGTTVATTLWEELAPELLDVAAPPSMLMELVLGFLQRTPALTPNEQASIIAETVQHGRHREDFDFARFSRTLSGVVQTGAALVGTGAQLFGGNSRTGQQVALWAGRIGQGMGTVNSFVQGLAPSRPAGRQPPARGGAPPRRQQPARPPQRPPQRQPPQRQPQPQQFAQPPAQPVRANPGQLNATALLQQVMNNPQLQQMLRRVLLTAGSGRREFVVEVATEDHARTVSLPATAVVDAVRMLAEQSLVELHELAGDEEGETPEYLLDASGQPLVELSEPGQRADVALAYIRAAIDGEMMREDSTDSECAGEFFEDWDFQ